MLHLFIIVTVDVKVQYDKSHMTEKGQILVQVVGCVPNTIF